jgi:predicted RNase H-like HicB family nuclease
VSNELAADAYKPSLLREVGYKHRRVDTPIMKKYRANFTVTKDRNGVLCAADMNQGIFTDGKNKEDLINNIREAVEVHFDVDSYSEVDINITEK